MAHVEESIDIRAPIQQVFAAVTDPRRTIEWNPNIVQVADIVGIPTKLGTSWRQVTHVAGRNVSLTCTVVNLNSPTEGVLAVSGDQAGSIILRCQDLGSATRLTQIIQFDPPGGIKGKLAMGLIMPILKREMTQTLARQRDVLEAEASRGSGSATA